MEIEKERVPSNHFFEPPDLLNFTWNQRKLLGPFMFWRILSVFVIVPLPIIVQTIVDESLPEKSLSGILYYTGVSLFLLLIHVISMRIAVANITPRMQLLIRRMRAYIFQRLQVMHFGFLDRTQTGKLLSKYAYDTNSVEVTVIQLIAMLIPEMIRGAALLVALAWVDPWLLLFSFIALLLFIYFRVFYFKPLRHVNHKVRVARERLTGRASELISAIKLIRGYGQESKVRQELNLLSGNFSNTRQEEMTLNGTMGYSIFSMTTAINILAVTFGAVMVLWDQLTLGALMALVGALPVILMPVNIFTQFSTQYYLGREAYLSIRELMQKGYVEKWRGKRLFSPVKGKVVYDNVSLKYEAKGLTALDEINLGISEGEHIALIGPSGSGKSSMVNLLLGLYAPTSGKLLIDGIEQEEIDMQAFRRQCAIVMQDSLLLSGSIFENISFGKPDATEAEVIRAAEAAHAREFIERLPSGFDSKVGERGISLSGGQRQRIAIARALLRDPRILILDEATSALDYENEKLVQDAMDRLAKNRTTVTVAHRLRTVQGADRLVILDHGRIAEVDTFNEMSSKTGSYLNRMTQY
ncbi:MAG: ABC transporter ATP-binding protein [Verrucomicrobiota bacterium]